MESISKLLFVLSLLSLAACGHQGNSVPPEVYYAQEAEKGNINDSLFVGFSFAMDSVAAVRHAIEEDLTPLYETQFGRDKVYMQKKRLEKALGHKLYGYEEEYNIDFRGYEEQYETMSRYTSERYPLDYYPYHSAYITSIVLQNEDGTYRNDYAHFGLSYYMGQLHDILVTIDGRSEDTRSDVKPEDLFNSIIKTYTAKYGEPYIKEPLKAIWVKGITHITVDFYGVLYRHMQKFPFEGSGNYSVYYPVFTIRYLNYPLELQRRQDWELEHDEATKKAEAEKAKEQAELEQRFKNNSI